MLTRLAITANPWPGSVAIWQSSDGASFEVAAVAAAPCAIGETLDDLPAGPTARWDRASSMRVKLYGGALASISDARVLEGGNAAAVQQCRWRVGDFSVRQCRAGRRQHLCMLSRLLRGQAGSEVAMAAPLPAGAPFVVLGAQMVPIAAGLDALARPMQLRIVASGRNHDDPMAVALTVTPGDTALKPLAPVHVAARRAGDGVHISWVRRTRIDGDGWGVEVPLGEESEAYTLEILSGGAVVRTIACTSPQALYAAADELADFGVVQTSLHIRVAQLSGDGGRGTCGGRYARGLKRFRMRDETSAFRPPGNVERRPSYAHAASFRPPTALRRSSRPWRSFKRLNMQLELLTFRFRQFG